MSSTQAVIMVGDRLKLTADRAEEAPRAETWLETYEPKPAGIVALQSVLLAVYPTTLTRTDRILQLTTMFELLCSWERQQLQWRLRRVRAWRRL